MDTQTTRTITSDLAGRTTVVAGASRGLGRGIARALAEAGAAVVAVARTGPALAELATTSANIRTEVADAADATVAWSLLDQHNTRGVNVSHRAIGLHATAYVDSTDFLTRWTKVIEAVGASKLEIFVERVGLRVV